MQRLEIANQIQTVVDMYTDLKSGELMSHDEAITMDFYTPDGGNFVMELHIARKDQPL